MAYLTCEDVGRKHASRPLDGIRAAIETLAKAFSTWRARRDRRDAYANLLTYDDRILADIGVRRDEVEWAAGLPLETNAALALRDRAHGRRAAERRARNQNRRDGRHLDRIYAAEMWRIGNRR